ncbi:MAG: gamma-glutamylcyclotransferase family protein [Erysipelotrichaceae bacterium]
MERIKCLETDQEFETMKRAVAEIMEVRTLTPTLVERYLPLEEEGFFCVVSMDVLKTVPGEERWYLCYEVTYHMSVLLLEYYMQGNLEVYEVLLRCLEASLSKHYGGHGYDADSVRIDALIQLYEKQITKLKMPQDMKAQLEALVNHYRQRFFHKHFEAGFGNLKREIERLLQTVDGNNVFVYGTLLEGERNHYLLEGQPKIDDALLHDHTLVELGSFPGIIKSKHNFVQGELYQIDNACKVRLDRLEGSLYEYVEGYVEVGDMVYYTHYYLYVGSLSNGMGKAYPRCVLRGKWRHVDQRYVWYATYGSNLCSARLDDYIDQTTSQNPYLQGRTIVLPYTLYFAMNSTKWDNKGVAFLDVNQEGTTYGVMYLMEVKQFEEIQVKEGKGWYNKVHQVGTDENGIAIMTLTHDVRLRKTQPSDTYLTVIGMGLKEHYAFSNEKISAYLECSERHLNYRFTSLL